MVLVMSAGASNTRCHFSDRSGWAFPVFGTSEFASEYNLSCNNAISMPNYFFFSFLFFFFCLPLLLFWELKPIDLGSYRWFPRLPSPHLFWGNVRACSLLPSKYSFARFTASLQITILQWKVIIYAGWAEKSSDRTHFPTCACPGREALVKKIIIIMCAGECFVLIFKVDKVW